MEARPKIKVEQTTTDKLVEAIGWCTLIVLWGLALFNYSGLPVKIPIHFNASGQVDNYGSKAAIIVLPMIATLLFVVMTLLNKHPHVFNYPVNITADNASHQYTIATRMIRYLKVAIAIVFTCLLYLIQKTATGKISGLTEWFLPITLGLIFIPVAFFLIKSYQKNSGKS